VAVVIVVVTMVVMVVTMIVVLVVVPGVLSVRGLRHPGWSSELRGYLPCLRSNAPAAKPNDG
jgi:hypothetical protein